MTDQNDWYLPSDFVSCFAYWIVSLTPYIDQVAFDAIKAFEGYINSIWGDEIIRELKDKDIEEIISQQRFEGIPQVKALSDMARNFRHIYLDMLAEKVIEMVKSDGVAIMEEE